FAPACGNLPGSGRNLCRHHWYYLGLGAGAFSGHDLCLLPPGGGRYHGFTPAFYPISGAVDRSFLVASVLGAPQLAVLFFPIKFLDIANELIDLSDICASVLSADFTVAVYEDKPIGMNKVSLNVDGNGVIGGRDQIAVPGHII